MLWHFLAASYHTSILRTLDKHLTSSVRKQIALQFVVSNLATVANFVLVMVLARILTPTDVGIFSMSAVLIAIAHVFRDFGVTSFIKREKTLTYESVRSAFGLLIATSWTMAVAMYFTANAWATFFGVREVKEVVEVLALGFVFIPFGSIPQALLTRHFKVERTALVIAVSTATYFSSSVMLAWHGFAHMTMAWANLINIIVTGAAYHVVCQDNVPFIPRFRGWGRMLDFGIGNLVTALIKAADNALPDVALGRMGTAAQVGLFSRANATVNILNTAVTPTIQFFAIPYLAKVHHTQRAVAPEYLRTSSIINCFIIPALACIALTGEDLILILFGNRWLESADAIPWLCAAFAVSSSFTLAPHAVTSVGRPMAAAAPLTIGLIFKIIAIILLFDGTLQSFALALFIGQLLAAPAYIMTINTVLAVSKTAWAKDVLKSTLPVLVLALAVNSYITNYFSGFHPAISAMLTSILVLTPTAFAYWILKLPICNEFARLWSSVCKRSSRA